MILKFCLSYTLFFPLYMWLLLFVPRPLCISPLLLVLLIVFISIFVGTRHVSHLVILKEQILL